MRLQFCALGVTMSWDGGFLGARASRPHKAWHSHGHLPHLQQPGTAPGLSLCLADEVSADRVAACSIALKLSGGQRDRMRAGRPRSQGMPSRRCGADHSRKNGRSLMKMNHEWTRIDRKKDGPASTTSGTKMRLQFCALGVTMSWDGGFLGARASRPHKACHSLAHLPHLQQPGTAPGLSLCLADEVSADRVAACSIALKLSGGQRDRMRAGRPRSQGMPSRLMRWGVESGSPGISWAQAIGSPLPNPRSPADAGDPQEAGPPGLRSSATGRPR